MSDWLQSRYQLSASDGYSRLVNAVIDISNPVKETHDVIFKLQYVVSAMIIPLVSLVDVDIDGVCSCRRWGSGQAEPRRVHDQQHNRNRRRLVQTQPQV